jgi:hypothetical protein
MGSVQSMNSGSVIALLNETGISGENLHSAYEALRQSPNPSRVDRQLLAEVCFLLAMHHNREGHADSAGKSKQFKAESIALYKSLEIDDLDRAAPILGNYLPDIMHEGVIRHRLPD